MSENSKIEWTDHTINFWWGCEKVSPACANCYAEALDARFYPSSPHWGPGAERHIRVTAARLEALRYEKRAVKEERRFRVFTNSMSDFFEDRRDLDGARLEALDTIRQTPHLTWMILTKRPEKMVELLWRVANHAKTYIYAPRGLELHDWIHSWIEAGIGGSAPPNVWLGTTVEDQTRADERIPALLAVPAAIRFLSCEPLLGQVELSNVTHRLDCIARLGKSALDGLDWVICGGESGPHARPMHPDWARGLRDQCAAAGVPFFFKQHGEWIQSKDAICRTGCDLRFFHDIHTTFDHVGKNAAGRLLDGIEHSAFPEVSR